MSQDPPRRRRSLTAQERDLWAYVTRHVAKAGPASKLRHTVMRLSHPAAPPAVQAPVGTQPTPSPAKARLYEVPSYAPPVSQPRAAVPPMAPIERRLKQRVARGIDEIDAAIDLHGMRQAEAHMALRAFLARSQAEGARMVLVVTGKGTGAQAPDTERGVLRRAVPQWLRDGEWRHMVIGFEEASRGHGGAGALYVRIRRR